jgi:hypothetical protein
MTRSKDQTWNFFNTFGKKDLKFETKNSDIRKIFECLSEK